MKKLIEVDIIRVVLIALLLIYHSLLPWCYSGTGSWKMLPGAQDNEIYWWLCQFTYSFFLECFVFLSGYILAFQVERKGSNALSLRHISVNKFKRLLIPSIFFSIIYVLIFGLNEGESYLKCVYSVLEGRGHMWFLPMLYWCFLEFCLLSKLKLGTKRKLLLVGVLTLCSVLPIPFRIGTSFYYLLFFFLGFSFWNIRAKIFRYINRPLIIFALGVTFFLCFVASMNINLYLKEQQDFIEVVKLHEIQIILKLIRFLIITIDKILYAGLGILFLLSLVNYFVNIKQRRGAEVFTLIASGCFVVYILQQFVLMWPYYHTNIVNFIHPMLMPWVGVITAFIISWCVYLLAKRHKYSRWLFGL